MKQSEPVAQLIESTSESHPAGAAPTFQVSPPLVVEAITMLLEEPDPTIMQCSVSPHEAKSSPPVSKSGAEGSVAQVLPKSVDSTVAIGPLLPAEPA
jgi:hypothetical protein